jgi:hypothetical protein
MVTPDTLRGSSTSTRRPSFLRLLAEDDRAPGGQARRVAFLEPREDVGDLSGGQVQALEGRGAFVLAVFDLVAEEEVRGFIASGYVYPVRLSMR